MHYFVWVSTNGLYSRNPGILFALDKGLKSVNCSNYPNFIQKSRFLSKEKNPATYSVLVVSVIKDTKIQICFLNNVCIKSSFLFVEDKILLWKYKAKITQKKCKLIRWFPSVDFCFNFFIMLNSLYSSYGNIWLIRGPY